MRGPRVELLYIEGCPNHKKARALIERAAGGLLPRPSVRVVAVTDVEAATRLRFLGSPTIRVDGRDVEPGADARRDYALSCRVYRTADGLAGQPDEGWIRDALTRAGA